MIKLCLHCHVTKDLSEFYESADGKFGVRAQCKVCCNSRRRENAKSRSEKYRAYQRNLRTYSDWYLFNEYKQTAKKRLIEFALTKEEFKLFWQKPCQYCGDPIKTIGLDRVDNTQGYKLGNIAPCCSTCNKAKSMLTVKDFIGHCLKIVNLNRKV